MINAKNVTLAQDRTQKKLYAGTPFGYAAHFGVWFDDKDNDYIRTKIKTHKLWGAAVKNHLDIGVVDVFLSKFLSDPQCPDGVRKYIEVFTAHMKGIHDSQDSGDWTQALLWLEEGEMTVRREYTSNLDQFVRELWYDKADEGR